jgi:hypothetical protein
MPSSRAWQCPEPDCGRMSDRRFGKSHSCYVSPDGSVRYGICEGLPVEVVVTPLAETREGWLREHGEQWEVTPTCRRAVDRLVLVVPMPEGDSNA